MTTGSIERAVGVFEDRIRAVHQGVEACVTDFAGAPDEDVRFLFAERLPSVGSAALPALIEIINSSAVGSGLRYMAAWVALALGERENAVSALLDEIESNSRWSLPAVNALAREHVVESRDIILEALRTVDPGDSGTVLQLSAALREVGGHPPNELKERLIARVEPWAGKAIRRDFPD